MGVASLVLGIVSIVMALVGGGIIAPILGIIGIVLGHMGRKADQGGMATAGFVLSIIGTVLGLLVVIACAACLSNAGLLEAMLDL